MREWAMIWHSPCNRQLRKPVHHQDEQETQTQLRVNAFYYFLDPGTYLPFDKVTGGRTGFTTAVETALYLSDTWDVTPKFSVELGIRYGFYAALGPKIICTTAAARSPETVVDSVAVSTQHGGSLSCLNSGCPCVTLLPTIFRSRGFQQHAAEHPHAINTTVISPTDI